MPSFEPGGGSVLYLAVCACPPAMETARLVTALQGRGWDVCVTVTPTAADWLDLDALEKVSGHVVRSRYRRPDEVDDVPLGHGLLVAPASFNTINKWAAGISDTLALGLMNEALGRAVPVWAVPWVNEALRKHPAYGGSLIDLDNAGVRLPDAEPDDFTGSVAVQIPRAPITA
jgi:phosphopantothenoylcysteine decarboxylase